MSKNIKAVAIGQTDYPKSNHIKSQTIDWSTVRGYVNGLVNGNGTVFGMVSANLGWHINDDTGSNDFSIDYWELTDATLASYAQNPAPSGKPAAASVFGGDLILAMSSGVVEYAQAYNSTLKKPITIVGVVSDPTQEPPESGKTKFHDDPNISGYQAMRHQTADQAFLNFVNSTVPPLSTVVLLHKANYNPSAEALRTIANKAAAMTPRIGLVLLPVAGDMTSITNGLNDPSVPSGLAGGKGGVLVLPADSFFANGTSIISLVQQTGIGTTKQKLPTFFFAPDWVQPTGISAFGAYGVRQVTCGANLAQTVSDFLNNPGSGTRWTKAQLPSGSSLGDFTWTVNQTVADQLGLKPAPGPTPPVK